MSSKDETDRLVRVEQEAERLRRKLRLLGEREGQSMFSVANTPAMTIAQGHGKSIAGLNIAYLVVDAELHVIEMNRKMAELIGTKNRTQKLKATISNIDTIPWAPQIFTTLLEDARISGGQTSHEVSYQSVDGAKHVRFCAVWVGNSGTVTAEDLTRQHRLTRAFERYVSPAVVEKMSAGEQDFLRTERRHLTILYADLRGFTSMCEHAEVEVVEEMLNEFFSAATESIDRFEGTVDKFVGDQVMALFGAPLPYNDHHLRGLLTALDLIKRHDAIQTGWKERGWPDAGLGIGLASGEVLVGNFGSERRLQYTVLGHTANVAARLCGSAKAGEILLPHTMAAEIHATASRLRESSERAMLLPEFKFKNAGELNLKGVSEPVKVARVALEE
ncbi:MAG: adenylate/guanylate cyclase domain-containing protein [Planctomycetes bacterium]|nr:adenylate/guanylate cyclase domain-containing protein [Planctomycetota bacterium]NUQ33515.1 adenylate/guanylate cyclase domain-containing protein [Planctomycetaceae bacterium]